ncbi:MAG: ComEA family DNA-binding protein [Candidatus Eremiobacterota bacterium]
MDDEVERAHLEVDEPGGTGNRNLAVALGVLVVLSLLVLGYYSRRPPEVAPVALPPHPEATSSPAPPPPDEEELAIKVYVAGEVKKPGVVTLSAGSRVEDAVRKAGGMTSKGDPLAINLAARVKDEQMIVVPSKGAPTSTGTPLPVVSPFDPEEPEPEVPEETAAPPPEEPPPPQGGPPTSDKWSQYRPSDPGSFPRVSLNRGTQAELEGVPGIGPELARSIVSYRQGPPPQHFSAVEDLLKVPGIKEKKLEKIRPYVDL